MALFAKKGRQNSDKCHFFKSDKCHFMLNIPYFFEFFQKMALIVIMPRPNIALNPLQGIA
jgi:hypothetical protein